MKLVRNSLEIVLTYTSKKLSISHQSRSQILLILQEYFFSETPYHFLFSAEMKIELTGSECFVARMRRPSFCKKKPLHFFVNGRNVLNNPRRGFNIVVLDSHTGQIERTMAFDTGMRHTEGRKLAFELQKLKHFKIVIGGVLNGDSRYVIPSAKLAIVSDF